MSLLLLFNQPPYHRVVLDTATRLLAANEPTLALVTAHMGCEIYAEQVIALAFTKRGIADLEDVITDFLPSSSLANERVLKLFVALTGSRIQDAPFWSDFKASSQLRNQAVHHGRRITVDEGKRACHVAPQFVAHLDGVVASLR